MLEEKWHQERYHRRADTEHGAVWLVFTQRRWVSLAGPTNRSDFRYAGLESYPPNYKVAIPQAFEKC